MYINKIPAIAFALSAFLAACAAPPGANIQPSAASVAKYGKMSDIEVVATLEKNVKDAEASGMPFLAPTYFKEAASVLRETRNQLGNRPGAALAKNAARGDAILEKGRSVMAIVQYRFAKELDLKARVDALDARKLVPAEYRKTMEAFTRLIEKVEREHKGNMDREQQALLNSLQRLEVHAVQEGALHEADVINTESKKRHADIQAPQTYGQAQRILADARSRIANAPRDDKQVRELGAQALFAARHAQQVNARVARLMAQLNVGAAGGVTAGAATGASGSAMGSVQVGGATRAPEKTSVEKIVLQEEDRLQDISTALGLTDLRDQPLDNQLAQIKRAAADAVRQGKGALRQDAEARLQAADAATRAAQAQLAEKDVQITALNARLAALEQTAGKQRAVGKARQPAKRKAPQPTK